MHLDPLILSRLHFVTGREIGLDVAGCWIRILPVSFGMGAVSGIIMPAPLDTDGSRLPCS